MSESSEQIFIEKDPDITLNGILLEDKTAKMLQKVVFENQRRDKLAPYGLRPRRSLLFYGPPGTGKTFGGEALAGELRYPFFTFNLESLSNQGTESALQTLAHAFETICNSKAIFLFDEFDAIAANRSSQNATSGGGDARRVVNDLLLRFEGFTGESILICATNFVSCIDGAFRRRFDTICKFNLPTTEEREKILLHTLTRFDLTARDLELQAVVRATQGLSFHETENVAKNAAKDAILNDTELDLKSELQFILDRKDAFKTNFEASFEAE